MVSLTDLSICSLPVFPSRTSFLSSPTFLWVQLFLADVLTLRQHFSSRGLAGAFIGVLRNKEFHNPTGF